MIRQKKCTMIPGETGQSGSITEVHVIAIDRSLAWNHSHMEQMKEMCLVNCHADTSRPAGVK